MTDQELLMQTFVEKVRSSSGESACLQLLEEGIDPFVVNPEGRSLLHFASVFGHVKLVETLLEKGVGIDQPDSAGCTPLMLAARSRLGEKSAFALLEAGADPHAKDADGGTALHYACACRVDRKTLVAALIDRGCAIDSVDVNGATPLMTACSQPNGEELCLFLLEQGACLFEEEWLPLHSASRRGHTRLVAQLLKRGAEIDKLNGLETTALSYAAGAGQQETVALLLEAGADPNLADVDSQPPLLFAVFKGDQAVASILLDHGANPNFPVRHDDQTILMMALREMGWRGRSDNGEMVRFLVSRGADPNQVDAWGNTAADKARKYSLDDLAMWLDRKGIESLEKEVERALADPSSINRRGELNTTLLMRAASVQYGEETALALLRAGADPHLVDKSGLSALHYAARSGHLKLMDALLNEGAAIDQADLEGTTPLMCATEEASLLLLERGANPLCDGALLGNACRHGFKRLVEALLERGVPVNSVNEQGETALHQLPEEDPIAAEHIAQVLLQHGADVCYEDGMDATPLHHAYYGSPNVVQMLLDHGAPVNSRGGVWDQTPLMEAADSEGGEEIALLLLRRGADPLVALDDGETALEYALKQGHHKLVAALLEGGAKVDQDRLVVVDPKMVQILLDHGVDPLAKNHQRASILRYACEKGHDDMIRWLVEEKAVDGSLTKALFWAAKSHSGEPAALALLDLGADPTATDDDGRTPLHFVDWKRHEKLTKALVSKGANVNHQDRWGCTPLIAIVKETHYMNTPMAKVLLKCGADPSIVDDDGCIAIDYAYDASQKRTRA